MLSVVIPGGRNDYNAEIDGSRDIYFRKGSLKRWHYKDSPQKDKEIAKGSQW